MKQLFILLVFAAIVISCENNDEKVTGSDIIGEWGLVEVLSDPGDGSGTFHSVNSNKILEFHADGTVSSNGLICSFLIETNEASDGTYSFVDSTISSSDCILSFEILGRDLLINYFCIEGCRAKYRKI